MTALQMEDAYHQRHKTIEPRTVFDFVSLDREFPGSIFSCLKSAHENARAVRGSLTSELGQFLTKVRDLGDRISTDFLVPPVEA